FDNSGGKFGSDLRLTVEAGERSHFVFLELAQLRWIEGVLKTSQRVGWRLPRSCVLDSPRRRVVLARFSSKGEPILRISECCANSKVFFVDIPRDSSDGGGWSVFLKLVQEVIGIPIVSGLAAGARSFAEVVGKSGLPSGGRCEVVTVGEESKVVVSDEGLSERLSYLEKGVVFRFVGKGAIVWSEFRVWMHRSWGVSATAAILPIGDGLWLLECCSKLEVNRICALKRVRFGNFHIFLDVWIKEAGRSGVLRDSDLAWVSVRGVPLHLRSQDLARNLGEALGGFIEWSVVGDLSTLRIKVKKGNEFPSAILISAGVEEFLVAVVPKVSLPEVLSDFKEAKKRKAKGKEVVVCVESARDSGEGSRRVGGTKKLSFVGESSGAESSSLPIDIPSSFVLEREEEEGKLDHLMETAQKNGRGCTGRSEETEDDLIFGCQRVSVSEPTEAPFVGFKLTSAGLLFGDRVFRLDGAGDFNILNGAWQLASGLLFSIASKAHVPQKSSFLELEDGPFQSSNQRASILDFVDAPIQSSEPVFGPEIGSRPALCVPTSGSVLLNSLPESSKVFQTEEELNILQKVDEESALCGAVSKVASILKLQVNDSLAKGSEEAIILCKEVVRRKMTSRSASWTERELKKLGPSPEISGGRQLSKRGVRCALPLQPFNEL
ncbi:hypothetical protein LINPERHAP1_LOCUS20482, partial [Linum perenne]